MEGSGKFTVIDRHSDSMTSTMQSHVGLDRVDSNGTPILDVYTLQRLSSPTGAFYETWAPYVPPSTPTVPAPGAPVSTESEAPADGTPVPAWVAVVAMLAALALSRRRRG